MALRIAVTGTPGVGKSTLVRKVVETLHGKDCRCRIGGVMAADKRVKERRVGFELLDLGSGARGMLADETGTGPQLGKYKVRLDDLDNVGAKSVEDALGSDLIVVDEVGPMELSSRRFIAAVEKALASKKPMLVVLHEWSSHPLAKKVRRNFKVITVTRENRDALAEEISREFRPRR
jgi:nucleoside-triphosphatase